MRATIYNTNFNECNERERKKRKGERKRIEMEKERKKARDIPACYQVLQLISALVFEQGWHVDIPLL